MDKDSYGQISEYFGIPTGEQLITNRHDIFFNRYIGVKKITYVKLWSSSLFITVNANSFGLFHVNFAFVFVYCLFLYVCMCFFLFLMLPLLGE